MIYAIGGAFSGGAKIVHLGSDESAKIVERKLINEFSQGNSINGEHPVFHVKASSSLAAIKPAKSWSIIDSDYRAYRTYSAGKYWDCQKWIRLVDNNTLCSLSVAPYQGRLSTQVTLFFVYDERPKTSSLKTERFVFRDPIHGVKTFDEGYAYGLSCLENGTVPVDHSGPSWGTFESSSASISTEGVPSVNHFMPLVISDLNSALPSLNSSEVDNLIDVFSDAKMDTNNIANTIEVCSMIKDLITNGPFGLIKDALKSKELYKRASEAWLAYRYQYCTTKADVQEFRRFVDYCRAVPDAGPQILRTGKTVGGVRLSQKVVIRRNENHMLSQAWAGLYEKGVAPSLMNAWDMVPFSFIVDWFIPIGDYIDTHETYDWARNTFEVLSYTKSIKYDRKFSVPGYIGSFRYSYYNREVTRNLPFFDATLSNGASAKTATKRIADVTSLVLGGA